MEQRDRVLGAKGNRGSEADMAGVPALRLRKGLGRAGDVRKSCGYAECEVPPLGSLDSGITPDRINAELRAALSEIRTSFGMTSLVNLPKFLDAYTAN